MTVLNYWVCCVCPSVSPSVSDPYKQTVLFVRLWSSVCCHSRHDLTFAIQGMTWHCWKYGRFEGLAQTNNSLKIMYYCNCRHSSNDMVQLKKSHAFYHFSSIWVNPKIVSHIHISYCICMYAHIYNVLKGLAYKVHLIASVAYNCTYTQGSWS